MDFPAEQLRAFAAVVDTGSFEGAAARLHITPSAVSQRIKALETQVGTVVVRRRKPASPTTAGAVLLRLARQVDLLAAEAAAELAGHGGGEGGTRAAIPVAVNADSLATWFSDVFESLAHEDGLEIELLREDESVSAELLRSGRAMAAVTTDGRAVQGCVTEPLGTLRYTAMASRSFADRWFGQDPLSGLASAPVVNFDRSDDLQSSVAQEVLGLRPTPPVHHVPDSTQYVRAVAAGLGWGMVPGVQDPGDGSLVVIDPAWSRGVGLYWQRWKLDSPALARVSAAVHRAARESRALESRAEDRPPLRPASSGVPGVRE
ncbi:LysR family transcriptional regulator ArgP [Arthrobacter sp. JSM 101049]|uniref:LysR family transcriptional regulator ArgP n=1 Tax=Arthrobacter sp. JSM 101049 TaxID=929097 RepID=UPI003564D762